MAERNDVIFLLYFSGIRHKTDRNVVQNVLLLDLIVTGRHWWVSQILYKEGVSGSSTLKIIGHEKYNLAYEIRCLLSPDGFKNLSLKVNLI